MLCRSMWMQVTACPRVIFHRINNNYFGNTRENQILSSKPNFGQCIHVIKHWTKHFGYRGQTHCVKTVHLQTLLNRLVY
jgi:hypothetical protein